MPIYRLAKKDMLEHNGGMSMMKRSLKEKKVYTSLISVGGRTTIPRAIREKLDLKEGDMIMWHIDQNRLVIKKVNIEYGGDEE